MRNSTKTPTLEGAKGWVSSPKRPQTRKSGCFELGNMTNTK